MSGPIVSLLCTRCNTPLIPALGGRFRCPRMSACGFGGLVETGALARKILAPAGSAPPTASGSPNALA